MDMDRYLDCKGNIRADRLSSFPLPEFKFAIREDIKDDIRFIPARADSEATGWDVSCAEPGGVKFFPFVHAKIRLGIRMFAPPGWWLELRPRSSTHAKKHLDCLYGVIDETYENEILFSCQYIPPSKYTPAYSLGDKKAFDEGKPIIPENWRFKENESYDQLTTGGGPGEHTYHGGVLRTYFNHATPPLEIAFGERIGQVIPVRRQEMIITEVSNDEFDGLCKKRNAARGTGGFGSTDL